MEVDFTLKEELATLKYSDFSNMTRYLSNITSKYPEITRMYRWDYFYFEKDTNKSSSNILKERKDIYMK